MIQKVIQQDTLLVGPLKQRQIPIKRNLKDRIDGEYHYCHISQGLSKKALRQICEKSLEHEEQTNLPLLTKKKLSIELTVSPRKVRHKRTITRLCEASIHEQ
jgi:hypothetical protein